MNVLVKGGDLPGLKALMARMKDVDRAVLVGVPAGAQHKDEATGETMDLVAIAAVHEFGSPEQNIPERSVLRQGIRNGIPKFNRLNVGNLRQVVQGTKSVDDAINMLGVVAVGEVKREFISPEPAFEPLKPATIAARKRKFGKASTRPLVASAQYRQSITYIVEGKQSANARII